MQPEENTLKAIEDATGRRPLATTPMAGATSSDLYLLRYPDQKQVLRLFRAERWDESSEALSVREGRILTALSSAPIQTPGLVCTLPRNGVLMTWLPGAVVLPGSPSSSWMDELAQRLADIHGLDRTLTDRYTSWNNTRSTEHPDWWAQESLWKDAQSKTAVVPDYRPVLIHRDYHPVNVLWEGERISGIVDWINACMGPAGIDVAHCRLNLAIMYGQEHAERFLEAYQAAMPEYEHDPYWDLDDALGALPDVKPYPPWTEFGLGGLSTELVRTRLQAFVQAAVQAARQNS